MHCIYPFTETILEKEIGINKIGYRQRIMNKLKEDSGKYIESLHKVKKVEYNNKTHIKHIYDKMDVSERKELKDILLDLAHTV